MPNEISASISGEFIPAQDGFGTINDAHAPESAARPLVGSGPSVDELNPEWVIARLMRESVDHGSRTRQSSRVAALGMLADILQLRTQGLPPQDNLKRAMELPPEERRRMIVEKAKQLVKAGLLKPEDLKGD